MANSLDIINSFTAVGNGNTFVGKQGSVADLITDEFAITVTGAPLIVPFSLTNDTKVTLWDDDVNSLTSFDYMHVWADQDFFLQLVGTSTNVTFKVKAKVPFVMSYNAILAAANTTDISTGGDPATTVIDHVLVLNRSGSTLAGQAAFFD